jgi:hypothetical protein
MGMCLQLQLQPLPLDVSGPLVTSVCSESCTLTRAARNAVTQSCIEQTQALIH